MGTPVKFAETFCSQCGGSFGPGDSGFSHCVDHPPYVSAYNQDLYASADNDEVECPACRGQGAVTGPEKRHWTPCRLCNETGVVSEQTFRDWPATP